MKTFIESWKDNDDYFRMLRLMGQLSNLFSESEIPYIHYRVTENLFCKYQNAENLSRTDTAYDARIKETGIGIKTFQINNNQSTEKIAEFNALSPTLKSLHGQELVQKLAEYRNERMNFANRLYGIDTHLYHIIGRKKGNLVIFNTDYDFIDLENLCDIKETDKSVKFSDGKNNYTFNKSKSVLMKTFFVPNNTIEIPIEIITDPYSLLETLIEETREATVKTKYPEYVILPLFSTQLGNRGNALPNDEGKFVPEKSGLNQWNAAGRPRDADEVYIPIPLKLHKIHPDFFPPKDKTFDLHLPDGEIISAKICQQGGKALMSNPNKDLGKWILRKILKLKENELVTIKLLDKLGFDSLIVYKHDETNFSINVSYSESYSSGKWDT